MAVNAVFFKQSMLVGSGSAGKGNGLQESLQHVIGMIKNYLQLSLILKLGDSTLFSGMEYYQAPH